MHFIYICITYKPCNTGSFNLAFSSVFDNKSRVIVVLLTRKRFSLSHVGYFQVTCSFRFIEDKWQYKLDILIGGSSSYFSMNSVNTLHRVDI